MRQTLAGLRAAGFLTVRALELSVTAQVECFFGHSEEALVTIAEALAALSETGERAFEAEVYRTEGEVLLANSKAKQAEQSFGKAIEIARRQSAKSWELRATTSLARLLCDTSRRDEARAMRSNIYNWFTEGFDTADLKDAKALLDQLGLEGE
jgi:predicted ATPase